MTVLCVGDEIAIRFGAEPGKPGHYRIEITHNRGIPERFHVQGKPALRLRLDALIWLALDTTESVRVDEVTFPKGAA